MKRLTKIILSITLTMLLVVTNLFTGFANAITLPTLPTAPPVIKPVTLQNIKYIYQQNVKKVDLSKYLEKDGAILPPTGTDVAPGNILVDEANKTAYYIQGKNPDGTLIMRKPTMSEVFENFDIPKQTIKYNESNIIDLQPSIQNARRGIANPKNMGTVTIKKIPSTNNTSDGAPQQKVASLSSASEKEAVKKALEGGWEYGFNNKVLDAYFEDGTKLSVTLSGKIQSAMEFDVDYSMFGGYNFGVTAGQVIELKAALEVKIKKEIYIPIIGIDIDFSIGGVRAGLFIVVGIDGKVTLVVAAQEGTSFNAGIKGSTCFGIPTSFHPYSSPHAYYGAECDPTGSITAYAYLTPSITVNVLGIDVFKAEIRVGFKAYAIAEGNFLNYGVNAVVQFYVAIIGKGKYIINSEFSLFSRKKESPPGGFFFYGDLCAYRDDAVIAIYKAKQAGDEVPDFIKDPFADKLPYVGPVQLFYYKSGNTTKEYKIVDTSLSTENKGVFTYNFASKDSINVAKGDSYRIVIPGNAQGFSSNVFSTIPFKGIKLDKADFFNELAFGQILPVSSHRDLPGWALTDVKSEGKFEQIFCNNREAVVKFVDPDNKVEMVSQTALTDSEGKFIVNGFDIRPYRKAIPYINIDGFEIEGTAIDSTAGIYCIVGSGYLSGLTAETIIQGNDGVEQRVTLNSIDEIAKASKITSEEYVTGDHILAVNEYGTKKIENIVDYSTNTYFVKNIEEIWSKAIVASKVGATVDLRKMIMDSSQKQLVYNDHWNISMNEANNSQIELFEGNINKAAKEALQEGAPLSSSHAYHKISVRDGKYLPIIGSSSTKVTRMGPGTATVTAASSIGSTPSINITPIRKVVSNVKIDITKNNFLDVLNPLQQMGIDATITLNMGGSDLTPNYATGSIYNDTKASIDIEGYKLFAEQADPWIIEGQKQSTQGISLEDKLKNDIDRFMKEGVLYFKRFVINPTEFTNSKLGTWRPSANTVKHELIVDYSTGNMSIDGIKFNNVSKGSMVRGKLYLPTVSLMRMMGGSSSFDSKSGKLTLNGAGRNIVLSTYTKTSVIAGKTISFKSDVTGTGKSTKLSTAAITKMFGANIKLDAPKSMATINFKGN